MNRDAIAKINRNIFESYQKTEDQVTHALAHAVASDEHLTEDFVEFLLGHPGPHGCTIEIQTTSKNITRVNHKTNTEDERETRPDLWIRSKNDGEFVCAIENKITDDLKTKQLSNHVIRAQRYGNNISLVAITQDDKEPTAIQETKQQNNNVNVKWQKWTAVYNFLIRWERKNHNRNDTWLIRQFCEFLQLTEERLIKEGKMREGQLTEFSGIPFSNEEPYNYDIAKNLLRKLMPYLRESKELKQTYPNLDQVSTRGKITDNRNLVWDFILLESGNGDSKKRFTNYPHLTVAIKSDRIGLQLTVPRAASTRHWKLLRTVSDDKWKEIFEQVLQRVSQLESSPQAYLELLHRHFPQRGAPPVNDGELFFALNAVIDKKGTNTKVKVVPAWKNYLLPLIKSKTKANIQLALGIQYFYRDDKNSTLGKPEFKDEAVRALCALKPFYDLLYGHQD